MLVRPSVSRRRNDKTVVVVRARFAILRISVRFLIISLFLPATFQRSALNGVFFLEIVQFLKSRTF